MRCQTFLFFQSFAIFFTLWVVDPPGAAEINEDSSTHTAILALDSAKRAVVADVARQDVDLRQATDYQDFIAYLNSRIILYCQELLQKKGPESLADLPCLFDTVSQQSSFPLTKLDAVSSGSTSRERSDALDASFMGALADFDDMLLQEEEKMASRIPSKREVGGGGGDGSGKSGIGGKDTLQQGTSAIRGIADSQGSDQREADGGPVGEKADSSSGEESGSSGGAGLGDQEQRGDRGTADGNRPPPEDDDIVARQLREAAQRETDPRLKKKLWEEYWKYKGK